MKETKPGAARLIQLDVLRGIAILLVLGCHYSLYSGIENAGVLQKLASAFYRFGWAGVDLFFVLSGFLVGGLLFQEIRTRGSLDVRRFLVRRGFKIWPLYFVYVGVLMARQAWTHRSPGEAFRQWWPNLLHVQNYFLDVPRRHTWSLAVEEHFYLALPLVLCLVLARKRPETAASADTQTAPPAAGLAAIPAVPRMAYAVIALCTAARWVVCARMPQDHEAAVQAYWWMYSATHLRVDSLFFGVLLAYWHHFEPARLGFATRRGGILLAIGTALVLPMVFFQRETGPLVSCIGYNMLYLGFGAILLGLVYTKPAAGKGNTWTARFLSGPVARVLGFIGVFSYPIYLWHLDLATYPLRSLVRAGVLSGLPVEARWVLLAVVNLALAVIAGLFWSALLERPSLAIRDRLFPRLTPPPMQSTDLSRPTDAERAEAERAEEILHEQSAAQPA